MALESEELINHLQEANAVLLAANKDCLEHFEVLKVDYDKLDVEYCQLKKKHAAASKYDAEINNLLRSKIKIAEAQNLNALKEIGRLVTEVEKLNTHIQLLGRHI